MQMKGRMISELIERVLLLFLPPLLPVRVSSPATPVKAMRSPP